MMRGRASLRNVTGLRQRAPPVCHNVCHNVCHRAEMAHTTRL